MPTITRWFVKTSLLCLILALLVGIYQQVPGVSQNGVFPVYLHLLTFGWLSQLIFGIAIWMLPKFSNERPRGYEGLNWGTYLMLNLGLLLRFIFEPAQSHTPTSWGGWALVLAALLQWLAGMLFILNAWPRVKGR
uniref:Hypothetical conserved protein n=1 Tax=uncultured Chloroflexota bacterium TaxID=166587 RepID=H5S9C2_9CHLR|nr:hypothetical conserved protein [uncultured Chloroflexota bacterium]